MAQSILLVFAGIGGAVATYLLHKQGISVVVASCIIGLIGAGLEHFFKIHHLAFIIFAGSFVGMSSSAVATWPLIIIGGGLSSILYQLSTHLYRGYGGRLGTIAFISTLISVYLLAALSRLFSNNK